MCDMSAKASKAKSERRLRVDTDQIHVTFAFPRFRVAFSVNTYALKFATGCSGNRATYVVHASRNIRYFDVPRELNTRSNPREPSFSAGMNTRLFLSHK